MGIRRTIENQQTHEITHDWSHILINGTGILNSWKWPSIAGLHSFSGPKMHSAAWDHSIDLENKTIAVIGTGSTSVQIVPQLQKISKHLQVYMRSPTWISPPFGAAALDSVRGGKSADVDPGMRQYWFTEEDRRRFAEDGEFHLRFRKGIEAEINSIATPSH